MKTLGAIIRKRLETLADTPKINPQLPRVWREILKMEAAAIESVINDSPVDEELKHAIELSGKTRKENKHE